MNLQKRRSFIISFTYFTIIILMCYLLLTRLIPMLTPFIAALAIAALLEPLVAFLERHMKGGRAAAVPLSLFLFYGSIFSVLFLSGSRIMYLMQEQGKKLPRFYSQVVEPGLNRFFFLAEQNIPGGQLTISSLGHRLTQFMEAEMTALSGKLLGWGAGLLSGFPSLLVGLLAAVIASCFLTGNYRPAVAFFLGQLPEDSRRLMITVWSSVREVTVRLLKAYALLMVLTFTELYAGFWVLGIPMKGACAALVTLVDILPVLGTGTVLLPWAFVSWVIGSPSLALGLSCLYLLIAVIRQTLEPKIIGLQMGLPPAATLLCIFAGGKLLGLAGVFLFPVAATVVMELNGRGVIHILKRD